MKKVFLIICCSFLSTVISIAQPQEKNSSQTIRYIRSLPPFVARTIPLEGKSLFWGKISTKPNEVPKGFHLYSLYTGELKEKDRLCHLALDIFSLSPKPRLLNRVFIEHGYGSTPTTYAMSLRWCKVGEKNVPSLSVRSAVLDSYQMSTGTVHTINFTNGWQRRADVNIVYFEPMPPPV